MRVLGFRCPSLNHIFSETANDYFNYATHNIRYTKYLIAENTLAVIYKYQNHFVQSRITKFRHSPKLRFKNQLNASAAININPILVLENSG